MPKIITYSACATALIAASTAIATCRPEPSPDATSTSTSAGASGAGGDAGAADDAAADAAESATSTTSTGVPAPACQMPAPRGTACDRDGDCFDSSPCTTDVCDLATPPSPPDPYGRQGTCRWEPLPDGAGCDLTDGTDTCRSGACCPPGATPPAPAATVVQPPEAR